jgi:hypothetical protein
MVATVRRQARPHSGRGERNGGGSGKRRKKQIPPCGRDDIKGGGADQLDDAATGCDAEARVRNDSVNGARATPRSVKMAAI